EADVHRRDLLEGCSEMGKAPRNAGERTVLARHVVVEQAALEIRECGAFDVPPVDPPSQLLEPAIAQLSSLRDALRLRGLAVASPGPAVFDPQAAAFPEDAALRTLSLCVVAHRVPPLALAPTSARNIGSKAATILSAASVRYRTSGTVMSPAFPIG